MPFANVRKLTARAFYLGQRLDLKAFERTQTLATGPLMISAGSEGAAVLFRYGVAVLFGLTAVEEVTFRKEMAPFVNAPFDEAESEQVELVRPGEPNEGAIQLDDFGRPELQIVADVLAKSAILSHYERALAQTFDSIEPLAMKLQSGGRFMHKGRELLQHIGDALLIEGKMVGRVEVTEKPELLWEEPQFERLYNRLEDEYELTERHRALERKLALVSRTAETMLDLLQTRRSLRVEWYIVILIVIEILLTLYNMGHPQ